MSDALPVGGWIVAALIVVVSLLAVGLSDLRRFSVTRIWAISGVCFRESIRRRILWIIPLTILGVILVSQLQRAIDEQDVIRQTTKCCIFATGLVVTLTSIILACTNLPREIENRVIYTVVTKPTTRLELVLGKIVGFSRVSALILIIMGLFSYGYLRLRTWNQEQIVSSRLATDAGLSQVQRNKLQHYLQTGLLTARSYTHAREVQIMAPNTIDGGAASLPLLAEPVRSIYGEGEEELLFPFIVDRQNWFIDPAQPDQTAAGEGIGKTGLLIGVRAKWHRYGALSETEAKYKPISGGTICVDILDATRFSLVLSIYMPNAQLPAFKDASSNTIPLPDENRTEAQTATSHGAFVWSYLPPAQAALLYTQPLFYVHVTGNSHNVQYFVNSSDVVLTVAPPVPTGQYSPPAPHELPPENQLIHVFAGPDGHPVPPLVRGRLSARSGQQLNGVPLKDNHAPWAVFPFRGAFFNSTPEANSVPAETRFEIEHTADSTEETDSSTDAQLIVRSFPTPQSADLAAPVDLKLENKQIAFTALPVANIAGGNFDVLVRCDTRGNLLGLTPDSLLLVSGEEPFSWNLAKSLLILWLLTMLVVTLAIFSSTFVSWPIAVVLTTTLLMGHWCVTQVADAADNTLGRSVATDMGLTDPSRAEAVASSVNALSSALQAIGVALPDIDRFDAIQAIEQGNIVSWNDLADALGVLAGFALPATVLAYVILKKKEVAP